MSKFTVKDISQISIIAALYAVLTVALSPLSYGPIQFRFSEVLVLLCFYKKRYGYGLILGCFIANMFSPYGVVDMIFGTLSTVVAVLGIIYLSKNLGIATIWPTLSCLIVAAIISYIESLPYFLIAFQVLLGEAIIMSFVAYPLFKHLETNKNFKYIVDEKNIPSKSNLKIDNLSIALLAVATIMFFSLPINSILESDTIINHSLANLVFNGSYYLLIVLLFPIISVSLNHVLKRPIKNLQVILLNSCSIICVLFAAKNDSLWFSLIIYILIIAIISCCSILFDNQKEKTSTSS